ncbi:BrnT family toxin [Sphingobium sp. AN558]|uniref:BrnT family toxin n=1 Tax=Sphingobium sp. AN558 TaxID=3133442 RepID=UPI0030C44933
MEFEWDEAKNAANIAKHGVGFATASRIFDGPVVTWADDRTDYGEVREHSIGAVEGILFLAVIHTSRDGKQRIISARRASRAERKRYEQAI